MGQLQNVTSILVLLLGLQATVLSQARQFPTFYKVAPRLETETLSALKKTYEARGFEEEISSVTLSSCNETVTHEVFANTSGRPITVAILTQNAVSDCGFALIRSGFSGLPDSVLFSSVAPNVVVATEIVLLDKQKLFYRPVARTDTSGRLTLTFAAYKKSWR